MSAEKYNEMTAEKMKLQAELADIKHRMSGCGRIPDIEYRNISKRRAHLVRRLTEIDLTLTQEKRARHLIEEKKNELRQVDKGYLGRHESLIGKIVKIRDACREMAISPTSTPAARFIYNKISESLNEALKP